MVLGGGYSCVGGIHNPGVVANCTCVSHFGLQERACDYIIIKTEQLPYSGKLLREKTCANFAVLWLFAKVFSTKFGGVVFFGMAKASNPRMFSLRKSHFSPTSETFLPRKFSARRYEFLSILLK